MSGDSQPNKQSSVQSGTTTQQTQGSQTATTQQQITPEQRALLNAAMPNLLSFGTSPPSMTRRTAGFDPTQMAAQESALAAAGGPMSDVVRGGANASTFLTSGAALDPNTNPGLQGAINAGTRPIYENLTQSVLPNIRSEAAGSGANYGSSRQGIAEGLASSGASNAAGDVAGRLSFQGYNTGLDAMTRALGLVPQTAGAQAMPSATEAAVGDVRQGQQQREFDVQDQMSNFNAMLPFITSQSLLGSLSGLPGQGVTSSGTSTGSGTGFTSGSGVTEGPTPETNWAQMLMGGGSLATGLLGSKGISALAPFLLSDVREKVKIEPVGRLFDGTLVYRFAYRTEPNLYHIGLLAQEVELLLPEAVQEIEGVKYVDYFKATERSVRGEGNGRVHGTESSRSNVERGPERADGVVRTTQGRWPEVGSTALHEPGEGDRGPRRGGGSATPHG